MAPSAVETVVADREKGQLSRLQSMLDAVLRRNRFYRNKLSGLAAVADMQQYRQLPFTTKQELSTDQREHPPYGTNLTDTLDRYIRVHQTSGTTGERLRWLDTEESWQWWSRCWNAVYEGAGVGAGDRLFFAFSFGPFIGFWSAHEGARQLGALSVPGGGMSSEQRIEAILANDVTVLVCTPTYALHLAEVATGLDVDLAGSRMHTTIHAGEPGASIPATKRRLEEAWGARCFDHAGATEVGAWGYECQAQDGVHLNEDEFICEVVDPDSLEPAEEGELVITNLGRVGMPVIRYRTGDRVRLTREPCNCGRTDRASGRRGDRPHRRRPYRPWDHFLSQRHRKHRAAASPGAGVCRRRLPRPVAGRAGGAVGSARPGREDGGRLGSRRHPQRAGTARPGGAGPTPCRGMN